MSSIMTNEPSLKKNYIYNLIYQVLTLITPLITTPYVSRILEADGIGIYSYTSAIMAYFTMFAALGTQNYGTREISRNRENKSGLSKTFWGIQSVSMIATLICLIGWGILIAYDDTYKYYFMALTPTLIATGVDISWFYIGLEQMKFTVLRNTICKVAGIIVMFAVVKQKSDLVLYMLLLSMVQLIGNLSMWPTLKRFISTVSVSELRIWFHFKSCLTYFVITIAISLYTVLDKVLIGLITHSEFQNGYYEQATKIINMAKMICFMALIGVMTSRMSYLFEKKKTDEIKIRIHNSFNLIYLLTFWIVAGIISVADSFVPVFFGPGYTPVIELLYWSAPLLIIVALSTGIGSHYYLPAGKISQSTRYTVGGSIINLLVNLALIPFWGAKGAVIGTLIGESVISVLYISNCDGAIKWKEIYALIHKRLLTAIIVVLSIFLLKHYIHLSEINMLIIEMVMVSILYFGILYLLNDKLFFYLIKNNFNFIWKKQR